MNATLETDQILRIGGSLSSADGYSRLTFQPDGNLVLECSRPTGWIARWASETADRAAGTCILQSDGKRGTGFPTRRR